MDTIILIRLHANGVNDDTPWFQAKADKRLVSRADGSPVDDKPGDYIAKPIVVTK